MFPLEKCIIQFHLVEVFSDCRLMGEIGGLEVYFDIYVAIVKGPKVPIMS